MKIFAMDTSSLTATVAVLSEEKLYGEYSVSNKLTHSQTILPMTDELLKNLNMTLNDMDVLSVCVGPGSFTGLRIGMATVKTFSQALSKPVVGVSSMDAMGYSFVNTKDYKICPIMDARRDEVYTALYENGQKISEDRALHITELLDELSGQRVIFCGDAAQMHRDRILSANNSFEIAPPNLLLPKASSVAYAALIKAKDGIFDDAYTLSPVYLRKSQAEREREEKLNGGK